MRIAMINMPEEYYSPITGGAVATVIRQTTRKLEQRGHVVYVLTPIDGNSTYEAGEVVPVRGTQVEGLSKPARAVAKAYRIFYRWDAPRYYFYLRSVLRELRRLQPLDAVIVHNDYCLPHHVRQVLGPSVSLISYVHNEHGSSFRFLHRSLGATTRFIAVSEYIRGRIIAKLPIAPARISVAINGVDRERFYPATNGAVHRHGALRVLFLGRLNRDKGPDVAAEAFAKLKSEGHAISFDFAGPVWWHGPNSAGNSYFVRVKETVERSGGRYLGDVPRDQVPTVMRQYDVLCVLSRWADPCPLVVAEGLASGCVVLASGRGGIPEMLGNTGVIADPDNVEDVCVKLRELIHANGSLSGMKQRCIDRASQLSWDIAADAIEESCRGGK